MAEENDNATVADAGKQKKKRKLSQEEVKGMSKYKAQEILNSRDPEILNQIEREVAARAAVLKKKIMIAGFIIMAIAVGIAVYIRMNS